MLGLRSFRPSAARASARALSTGRTVGAFSAESIGALLPKIGHLNANSTLGQVWDAVYVKYQFRLIYPVALWAGFLWYNLWVPDMPAAEKKVLQDRLNFLKDLEFHQK
ncbi:hypothetical protein BCR33DRAFT_716722 [Rhizoclosmatium globosum]|uniref:Uncharacterized protein n=1 Tax=Rhizoclosmatium globosum TaxID=329046 RepID=A0A1Y2CCJ3_9FUNG|nr:hypothetical protein HDU79_009359 [Rhizoclosmatium sp. JEL0117]ORY44760.1 hypothetical protein BCR33DRAFT_716722 [Rhizoclosmatium globosum]|eukprot:ORY44760.1 hypothetical protein BCR33DRAFT_716722 [Rhizoclosmatium globosum]